MWKKFYLMSWIMCAIYWVLLALNYMASSFLFHCRTPACRWLDQVGQVFMWLLIPYLLLVPLLTVIMLVRLVVIWKWLKPELVMFAVTLCAMSYVALNFPTS